MKALTLFYIECQGIIIYASSEYQQVFERRDEIEGLGECNEPHPLKSRIIHY